MDKANINNQTYNDVYSANSDAASYTKASADQATNPESLSVSDALQIAKIGLETIKVRILGEISEISNNRGYKAVYFTIKDKMSSLPCLMWKNKFDRLNINLEVGSLVEISGKFSLYAAKGRMNFDVDDITLAGEGQLRMMVARIAKKLESEGLTDISRKKIIPVMPERIGLVTSPRGAVVHDVIRTLNRRMPIAKLVFAGCAVEGPQAPKLMIQALDCLENAGVDVICLCRGGGSFEDLMPFNDEDLARKIASLKTPVVTGIGHEPDTTIADLVSDFRASTPTGAAQAVSFDSKDFIADYSSKLNLIKNRIISRLKLTKEKLDSISSRPIFADGANLFSAHFQTIDYNYEKLKTLLDIFLNKYKNSVAVASAKLHDKSPLVILSRGYSATTDQDGNIIKCVNQVERGQNLNISVMDGKIGAVVESSEKLDKDLI